MRKIKINISIILFAILFNSSSAYALSLNQRISEGEKNYNAKNYAKALEDYKQAQIEEPENDKLKYNLGNSAYKAGKYDDAVKTFKSLSEQSKSQDLKEKSLYNLGNTYYKQAKLEDAEKAYVDALKIDSNDIDAKKNLEKVREEMKKRQQQEQQRKEKQKKDKSDKKEQNKSGDKKDSKDKGKQDNKQDKNQNKKNDQNQKTDPGKKDNSSEKNDKQNKGEDKQPQKVNPNAISKEEAERWLDSVKDENKEVMKKQILKKPLQGYNSEKDW